MDLQIALLLGQDGIVNGAIYALMALALVLVFSVTRVIFIPQGELVAFGALSMAAGEYVSVSTQRDSELALLAIQAEDWMRTTERSKNPEGAEPAEETSEAAAA